VVLMLAVLLTGNSLAELQLNVYSQSGLDLTEEQKLDVMQAPGRLLHNPAEHLAQAIQSGDGLVHIMDESDDDRMEHPYTAIFDYAPITISEIRSVDPEIVCQGKGIPPEWTDCFDNSTFFVNLPNHIPIAVDSWTTPEQVLAVLAVIDQVQFVTPTNVIFTSDGVNHVLRRTGDVYAAIGSTPDDEHVTIDLRRLFVGGSESYEVIRQSAK
jgi:hypothetical protein